MKNNCQCEISQNVFNGVCGKCLLPLDGVVHGEGGNIIEDMSNWKQRQKNAIAQSEPNKHAWFKFKSDNFDTCGKCGFIKNKKNATANCKGASKISFREKKK